MLATTSAKEIKSGLGQMKSELFHMKKQAEGFMSEVNDMKPEDIDVGVYDASGEGEDEGGKDDHEGPAPDGGGESGDEGAPDGEGKESPNKVEIKTPEDAKRVLEEAKKDLEAVTEHLDGLCGQSEEEEKKASLSRHNEKYATKLSNLAETADKAISDARSSLNYWSFLKQAHNAGNGLTDPGLKHAANTIREVGKFSKLVNSLLGKKEATAVPPDRSKFTGDKDVPSTDAHVEVDAWHAGAEKFKSDRTFENKRPNPAVDNRLDDVDYKRFGEDKPYVNATFVHKPENKFSSYWDVIDTKTGKRFYADFTNMPEKIGRKTEYSFNEFASQEYGKKLLNAVIAAGPDSVRADLNGTFVNTKTSDLKAIAAEKGKDKSTLRKYYADAFGDKNYARELTSAEKEAQNQKTAGEGSPAHDKMETEYKPADEHPSAKNNGSTKDGPGKLSNKVEDPEVIKARARRAIELARVYAACEMIPFTKTACMNKGAKLMALTDEQFSMKEATLAEFPVKHPEFLTVAHIPDTEVGISGNTSEAVRDPKAKVKTEDLNSSVKSDAAISKSASFAPQMQTEGPKNLSVSSSFRTVEQRLQNKGVDLNKLRRPKYRNG
jgi:hypothetical protein